MERDIRFDKHFLYTQHSLSTYIKCPLKFKKRYIENLKWDTTSSESINKSLTMGQDFHLIAQRYFLGIKQDDNLDNDKYNEVYLWYNNLKNFFKLEEDCKYYPEYKIRLITDKYRLEANMDLMVIKENEVEIWDFKTNSNKNPKIDYKKRYISSLQTKVYLFVLRETLEKLFHKDVPTSNIKMHYYTPIDNEIIVSIEYDNYKHQSNKESIIKLMEQIKNYNYSDFNKELYIDTCKFCEFNWYCNNQKVDLTTIMENDEFSIDDLDFDLIDERF